MWRRHHHCKGVPENLQHRLCHPQFPAKHSARESKCKWKRNTCVCLREGILTCRPRWFVCSCPTASSRHWIYWGTNTSIDPSSWCTNRTSAASKRRWTGGCAPDRSKKFHSNFLPRVFCNITLVVEGVFHGCEVHLTLLFSQTRSSIHFQPQSHLRPCPNHLSLTSLAPPPTLVSPSISSLLRIAICLG